MPGKEFRIPTGESETGAQNEPLPVPVHQAPEIAPVESEPQEAQPQE